MRRGAIIVTFVAAAFAFAWPMQFTGYNQNAHYALAKALARGVPYVDQTLGEVGDLSSGDVARRGAHLYTVKAPGLALVSVPPLLAAEAAGMRTTGDPTRALYMLHLVGAVLPGLLLVVALWWLLWQLEPQYALIAAATLALATMVLPFATLYFAHSLSTAAGFGAFAVAYAARHRSRALAFAASAGALAGFAVVVEPQLFWLALIVGIYSLRRSQLPQRAAAYGAGVAAGLLPMLAFDWWAFGDPTHTPYRDYWAERGQTGFFRLLGPAAGELSNAVPMLFSAMGLLVLTPVVAAGVAGLVLMARRGPAATAVAALAVVLVYLLYHSGTGGFGGLGPPRYLLTIVPFASVGLAAAYRLWPLPTLCLAGISAFQMVVMTATGPLTAYDGAWLARFADRTFVLTGAALVEVTGWYSILPFFAAAGAAAATAVAATRFRTLSAQDFVVGSGAATAWALLALAATNEHGRPPETAYVAVIAPAAVLLAVAAVGLVRWRLVPARVAG